MPQVIGVMSTFCPDKFVIERARRHIKQLDLLIVVDDGSLNSEILNDLTESVFEIIRLDENSGIAAALNTGMKTAISKGADFIVNLDQDSILEDSYIEKILSTFRKSATSTRLGIVVTDSVNNQPSIPPKYSPEGFGLVEEAIQSGMVIRAECLQDIGFLDERLFIDCVDIEFCLRAIDKGWNIAVAPGSNIIHSLGRLEAYKPFGLPRFRDGEQIKYQYHPPFRRYYIVRNNIDLCIRNLKSRPRWVASVLRRELNPQLKTLLSGPNAGKQWLSLIMGLVHGLIRRRGKIPNWLSRVVS